LILDYNTNVIVWMFMNLVDRIKKRGNTNLCSDVHTVALN
jgi:hypothetical protein